MPEDDVKLLIERFEKDILYDAHGLVIKVSRSESANKLISLGKDALGEISEHLDKPIINDNPELIKELRKAWCLLLCWLCDVRRLGGKPTDISNFNEWVIWAKKLS